MARRRDQERRRSQLIDAAIDAVAEKGLAAVQLRDVAKAADLTPGAVLYYYDDLHDLLHQVYERATQRYSTEREAAIAVIDSPARQLGAMLAMAVPDGPDDTELRLLFEFDAMIFSDTRYIEYARQYLRRQLGIYQKVLDDGVARGQFTLTTSAEITARNLLALEDSHGFSVLIGELSPTDMLAILHQAAATATGVDSADLARDGANVVE